MKIAARIALVSVGLAWGGLALAEPACTYREEEVAAPATAGDSVTLLNVDPPEGGELRKDMVVVADVQFQIADFRPDTYFILVMFPTAGFGGVSPGDTADTPMLQHSSGKVRLCVPLQEVYDHPRVLWPLSMSFQLLKKTDTRSSLGIASTPKMKFKSADAPANQNLFPDEYYDALQRTNTYFDTRAILYKVCIARFPAAQPELTKAYRAWEARHRADIELVAELQFEDLKNTAKGRADFAASIADSMFAASLKSYEGFPPAVLKRQCDMKLAEFADPDDTTDLVVGDQMAILRKHSGKDRSK